MTVGCRHCPHSRSTSRRAARGTYGEHAVLSEETGCVAKEEGISEDVTHTKNCTLEELQRYFMTLKAQRIKFQKVIQTEKGVTICQGPEKCSLPIVNYVMRGKQAVIKLLLIQFYKEMKHYNFPH